MNEIYRKRGRAVRWENGRIIRVIEAGVAIEDDERFVCHPDPELAAAATPFIDAANVEATARKIQPNGVRIERLIVNEGEADHTFRDRTWHEHSRRIHLAIAKGRLRTLIDLANFEDLDEIATIAAALARAEESERDAPPRLRLAPNVTAALLPSLVGIAPPNVTFAQRAGGVDGKGDAIEAAIAPWPNYYRPSYRVRPTRVPFNLTATCDVTEIDETRPIAVAILAPPAELTLHVLVVDGARVYPSTVRIARIDAISAPRRWYPYGAGVWGAELML